VISLSTSRSQQQHYIPKFLLKHFCDESGYLWAVSRESPKPFRKRPSDLFHVRNLYSNRDPDRGQSVQSLSHDHERTLAEIEGRVAPVIMRISENVRTNQWPFQSPEDEILFKRFFLSMARRTPDSQLRMLDSKEGEMLFHDQALALSNQGLFERMEWDAVESMRIGELKKLSRGRKVYASVATGDSPVARREEQRFCEESGLCFLRSCSKTQSFLIGSHGIGIIQWPDGQQTGFLPLASDLCVMPTESPDEISICTLNNQSDELVRDMNKSSTAISRMIAGNSKSLVGSYVKLLGS